MKAVEVLDECLGRVVRAAQEAGARVLITADHGNLEVMADPGTGQPHTAHTTDPVPFILFGEQVKLRDQGLLADVAPTVLQLLIIAQAGRDDRAESYRMSPRRIESAQPTSKERNCQ